MNVLENLTRKYNKKTDENIYAEILIDPGLLADCMQLMRASDWRLSHRISGPLTKIAQKQPEMLDVYQLDLLEMVSNPLHDAHLRNALRIFQYLQIQEEIAGRLYNLCYQHVENVQKPTAIRAFSATVMKNIASQFNELRDELLVVFNEYKDHGTVGFTNRVSRLIQEILKESS